jgi:phosphatidylglycerol:prolipoprotein diacylglycerol transferase
MAAAGSLAGFLTLLGLTRGMKKKKKTTLFIFAVLIFFPFYIGARLGFILECLIQKYPGGCGFTVFGAASLWPGLITATLCAFPIARQLGVDVWEAADTFAPAIAIGGVFIRIGCLLRGCCFGIPCAIGNPLGTYFTPYSRAYSVFGFVPLYPAQVFSSLAWLIVFLVLISRFGKKRFRGEIILIFTFIYSFFNFFIDFFRFHEESYDFNRFFSILFVIISVLLYAILYRRTKSHKW